MNLDAFERFSEVDKSGMLAEIDGLPAQLQAAWELAFSLPMPDLAGVDRVVIAGMGGSAIGADLLAAYARDTLSFPLVVWRDYDLPAWARGSNTLVIASSHSGNTEETLSAFTAGHERGCRLLAVTRGGQLAQLADEFGAPTWKFVHNGQPRAAVGYSFGILLGLFVRAGWLPDQAAALQEAVAVMSSQQGQIAAQVPAAENPAKQWAQRMQGKWVAVFGSGFLEPVARRWKGQISEIAKAWAQFEFLPEADHNTLAGLHNPKPLFENAVMVFLRADKDHPRHQLRAALTAEAFTSAGLNASVVDAPAGSALAQQWAMLHLGDYISFYLAMLYDTDPTPVTSIEGFKAALKAASGG